MSEKDTTDPKGMHPEARKQYREHTRGELRNRLDRILANTLEDVGERMFREGVIAGLRCAEHVPSEHVQAWDANLRINGQVTDLLLIQPEWCECDPKLGYVCSPRRRPAECDVSRQRDAEAESILEEEKGR